MQKSEWLIIDDKYDIDAYKKQFENLFPKNTDSDLTFEVFKTENPDRMYILNLNGLFSCAVSLFIDPNNSKIVTNLSVVIFGKQSVFRSLKDLITLIKSEFDEVSFFTKDNTTTDRIIKKMSDEFNNDLFKPILKNINLYQYKK